MKIPYFFFKPSLSFIASQTFFRQLYTKCQFIRNRNVRGERLNLLPADFLQALDGEERQSEDPPYERNVYYNYPANSLFNLELKTVTKKLELERKGQASGKS